MATTNTTSALNGLLYIYNGDTDGRWNYVDAVGTPVGNPGGLGNAVSLTYSFLASKPGWATADEVSVGALNLDMKSAAEQVLAHISDVVNINFTKAPNGQLGQITFATSDQADLSSAWAYQPYFQTTAPGGEISSVAEPRLAGSVWINNAIPWTFADWQPGSFGYSVLLHEMGHALGLKHTFEGSDDGGGFVLDTSLDHEGNTVMSYTEAPRTWVLIDTGTNFAYDAISPSTLMWMDIAALQHVYGANMETESGATVYHWETNEELLETIWDGGGIDILDCSNQTLACRINLGDGEFSSVGMRRTNAEIKLGLDLPGNYVLTSFDRANLYNGVNNLAIAKNATIENATGGSAGDTITGNNVANRLAGGAGNDTLAGGIGNDWLAGGRGLDRLNGGTGRDVFDFDRLRDSTVARADVITGFMSGIDRIDLSTLDANGAATGNQAFTFIGASAFSAAGQVRFSGGVLYGSTDADTSAEFVIQLSGVTAVAAGDLVL
jgi:serralysin